ncbi:MAG: hypothetical protein ACXWK6_02965, partial [Myxococcaceae bacterium]
MRPSLQVHLLLAGLVLGAGLARAQGPTKPPPPPTLEKAADIPDPEKLTRATAAVSSMRSALTDVLG